MPKSSAFRHSRIYRRKIRGACPRIFQIFIEIGLRPKSLIDFCNSLKAAQHFGFEPLFICLNRTGPFEREYLTFKYWLSIGSVKQLIFSAHCGAFKNLPLLHRKARRYQGHSCYIIHLLQPLIQAPAFHSSFSSFSTFLSKNPQTNRFSLLAGGKDFLDRFIFCIRIALGSFI